MSKVCFKCHIEKDYSEFYPHKKMSDGYLNKCKACTKRDVANREQKLRNTDPEWVEKEKERARGKYYRLGYKELHKPTKDQKAEMNRRHRARSPEKFAARNASWDMPKPAGHENHHWSYRKEHWRDVIQLTFTDHDKLHRYLKYDPVEKQYRTREGSLLDTKEKHLEYFNQIKNLL